MTFLDSPLLSNMPALTCCIKVLEYLEFAEDLGMELGKLC